MPELQFRDLVEISELQALLDSLYRATGIPTGVLTPDGAILTASGWQDACTQFHRKCPASAARCGESDTYITGHLHEGSFVGYRCRNGLNDYACPIMVEEQHVATLFTGQLFLEPPDDGFFREQALEFGFEPGAYLEAIHRVPIIEKARIPTILEFLSGLARNLAATGISRLREQTVSSQLFDSKQKELCLAFDKLTHEKQRVDAILNGLPGIFYTMDFTGRLLSWNTNLERTTGYSCEELARMRAQELFMEEEQARIVEAIGQVAVNGEAMVEASLASKDGQITPYLFSGTRADIGGTPLLVGMGIDIAERRKVEADLRMKNQVFENSIASQSIADRNGIITHVNSAFLRIWGYESLEEAIGQSVASFFVNTEDATPVLEALAARDAWEGEFLARHADGTTFISRGFATSLRDAAGELNGYQSTNIDITRERESEASLRQSQADLLLSQQLAHVGSWRLNAATNQFAWSEELYRMMGFDPALAPPPYDEHDKLFSPESWSRLSAAIARTLKTAEPYDLELEMVRKNGTKGWKWSRGEAVKDAAGRIIGLCGASQDISERKRIEAELDHTVENLKRSNDELAQFAYVASHDLQEPLRMVSSYTQLLAKRYKDQLDQDAQDFINYAVDGANRMQRLIQDLLEYSRVTSRGQAPAPLDAHDALGLAVTNLQSAIQESGAMIANAELPMILGDRSQIAQVFQNLIGNAIKFHKPGEPPRVSVCAGPTPGRPELWTFRVEDNGIGIEPRHFERLFVIFQRLHGKQEYPGTGIGLALCKRIVERHGGRIWLESEAGKGTTFFFTLPAAPQGKE